MNKPLNVPRLALSAVLGLGLTSVAGYATATAIDTFTFTGIASRGISSELDSSAVNVTRSVHPSASYSLGRLEFEGTVSPDDPLTWGDELWVRLVGSNLVSNGTATQFVRDIQLGSGGEYNADTVFSGSYDFGGEYSVTSATTLDFEFYEGYDDNGPATPDATWSQISFSLSDFGSSPPAPLLTPPDAFYLGEAGIVGDLFNISTIGSDFDTMMGLYNASGELLVSNDDYYDPNSYTTILQSQLSVSLDSGRYYVAANGYGGNSNIYDDDFEIALSSSAFGSLLMSVNGLSTSATLGAGEIAWYSFDVLEASVPEPGTLALLSLGLAGWGWRRPTGKSSAA